MPVHMECLSTVYSGCLADHYFAGRFEVCAKLPAGQGYWPAHWLMPDDSVCWPDGELTLCLHSMSCDSHVTFPTHFRW